MIVTTCGKEITCKECVEKNIASCMEQGYASCVTVRGGNEREKRERGYKEGFKDGKKEAAKEIFQMILSDAGENGNAYLPSKKVKGLMEFTFIKDWIKEVAENYNVEVEE